MFYILNLIICISLGLTIGSLGPLICIGLFTRKIKAANSKALTSTLKRDEKVHESKSEEGFSISMFENLILNYPSMASKIVENFIAFCDSKESIACLLYLIEKLPDESMIALIKNLKPSSVIKWKHLLATNNKSPKDGGDVFYKFFLDELLTDITPSNKLMLKVFLSTSRNKMMKFVHSETYLTSSLLHVFKSRFYTEISKTIDADTFCKITKHSLNLTKVQIKTFVDELTIKFKMLGDNYSESSLLNNFVSMLSDVAPAKERALFEAIALKSNRNFLVVTAQNYIPVELIDELPCTVKKEALSSMSLAHRVGLLYTSNIKRRDSLLKNYASTGTRSLDIVQRELERIENDWGEREEIKRNKSLFEKEFIKTIRVVVKNNEVYKNKIYPVIEYWASSIMAKSNSLESIGINKIEEYGTTVN